jgi:hypothetical protein
MLINYNEQNNETANVSIRDMKTEAWSVLKKLAALNETTMAEYLDQLVREELERISHQG